eukprot:160649-Chlamydomonas_euryale.AAC.4
MSERTSEWEHERVRGRHERGDAGSAGDACVHGSVCGCEQIGGKQKLEAAECRKQQSFGSSRVSEASECRKQQSFGSSRVSEAAECRKQQNVGSSRVSEEGPSALTLTPPTPTKLQTPTHGQRHRTCQRNRQRQRTR